MLECNSILYTVKLDGKIKIIEALWKYYVKVKVQYFFSVMSYEIREGLVDIKRIIISKNVRCYWPISRQFYIPISLENVRKSNIGIGHWSEMG